MEQQDKMYAAIFHKEKRGRERISIDLVPKPQLQGKNDVLIRMEAVAICGTDTRALSDPPAYEFTDGIIVGHEACGIVEAVGADVTNCSVGDKVVIHPNIWCGKCAPCREGRINLCEHFRHIGDVIDGAMAGYLCIEERMVYPIKPEVPSHIAAMAEPLACVLNGTTTCKAHPGETVVVLGGGPIGLLFCMLYRASGATVILSERSQYRRELAQSLGVSHTIDPTHENLEEAARTYARGGADIVVDAQGAMLAPAMEIAGRGGRIVVIGINQTAQVSINQFPIVAKELVIRGTYITKGTMALAVKIIEEGLIPLEKLCTHRLPLEKLMDGIALSRSGQAGKVVIDIR